MSGPEYSSIGDRSCGSSVETGKPKLLVILLWGLGDLILATPFIRAASEKYEVTLLAKPHAEELKPHFWPTIQVVPFIAPWTAFHRKYRWWRWPWWQMVKLGSSLRAERFAVAVSARRDPRDHLVMLSVRALQRIGFPRMGSQRFLTQCLMLRAPTAHITERWAGVARALGLALPAPVTAQWPPNSRKVLIHTGAGQLIRSWPLERYQRLCQKLRAAGFTVQVACDRGQREWWLQAGESGIVTPASVDELVANFRDVAAVIGNDSGPGHIAAAKGLPTFTIFGPQLPEWFAPRSANAWWVEGKACPYKPCSDYCHFPVAHCLERITEEEVWEAVTNFLGRITGSRSLTLSPTYNNEVQGDA